MELKIIHLYPELMSLYGEYANLSVLRRHLEDLGIQVAVTPVTFEDEKDFSAAGLIYMGAGTERGQKAVLRDLLPHRETLAKAAERGSLLFFTGNSMEVFGQSVTDAEGHVWEGLGLAEFATVETRRRDPQDVIARPVLWQEPAVGFMNKCSRTTGVEHPLFSSLDMGFGNEAPGGAEGYCAGNLLATHITGPVLVKNPAFTAWLVRHLSALHGWQLPEQLPAYPHEDAAYQVTVRELSARLNRQGV